MLLAIDETCNLGCLLAIFAEDAKFVLAVLPVPNGEFTAKKHGYANLTGVWGYRIQRHECSRSQKVI